MRCAIAQRNSCQDSPMGSRGLVTSNDKGAVLGGRMLKAQSDRPEGRLAQNTPRSRGSLSHGHLVWPKVLLCAMALVLGATTGLSQWLETRITLPDTLGGALHPTCLTTDTSERYVYIGDHGLEDPSGGHVGGGVYVVDAEARTRVAKIPFGFISAVCTNTRRNKVYAADYAGNQVLVISCVTNQVVATTRTGAFPIALCYNSNNDKVYVADSVGTDLTVIDCSSDEAIKTIHLGGNPQTLCYNPASNRVFCEMNDAFVVIDGASDSVVAIYAATWWSGPMVVNAVANRVYLAGIIAGDRGLFVLDGTSGAVLDSLPDYPDAMCLNPNTQKLYTGNVEGRDFLVYDCTGDTLIRRSHFGASTFGIYSMVCDTATGKVYAACTIHYEDVLVVMSGVTDTIAAKVPGPSGGRLLASARRGCVYSTDGKGPDMAVFDTGTDRPLCTIMIGGSSSEMCYDSTDDKVYYVNDAILGEVGSIDAATNQPVGHVQVGSYPNDIIWHAPVNRVYCSGVNDITVIDPTADTILKVIPAPGLMLCSAPHVNKVYAVSFDGNGDLEIAVIDCRHDSVIKRIPILPISQVWSMCYVSTDSYDKLYVGGFGGLSIVDCMDDSLVRSYPWLWSEVAAGRDGERVHCSRRDMLCTFDPAGDTLVAAVQWEVSRIFDLLHVPGVEKLYCAHAAGNNVLVADAESDSIIAEIPLRMPTSFGYDSESKLVYVSCGLADDSMITFVDSRTDSIVGSLNPHVCPTTFTMVPAHHRVYVGSAQGSVLSPDYSAIPVIRTDPPGVAKGTLHDPQKKIPGPTILPRYSQLVVLQPSILLDAAGRKVCDLNTGSHVLARCRAGVYFVRTVTGETVKKLLLVD
jgi:YVTN family beta-propeller protein